MMTAAAADGRRRTNLVRARRVLVDMRAGFATVTEDQGVLVTSADVDGFTLAELRFPPGYIQGEFEPDLPYLALVLDGALEKSFRLRTIQLDRACALTMPTGATHGARFGPKGARIVIVKPKKPSDRVTGCLDRLVELRESGLSWLAWRLAGELHVADAAAPLAAEGFALELLAATSRETRGADRPVGRPPAWLGCAEEMLRARVGDCVTLGELADAVGVHPTHLARVFRARYGVSVGEYGRRVRLAWAATEVARTETLSPRSQPRTRAISRASSGATSGPRPRRIERKRRSAPFQARQLAFKTGIPLRLILDTRLATLPFAHPNPKEESYARAQCVGARRDRRCAGNPRRSRRSVR
jgi:AraC-like DNA-binding protein